MAKQTKKLIAIFAVMVLTMFAVIKAFGIDCTWRDRVTKGEEVEIESPEDLSSQNENQ